MSGSGVLLWTVNYAPQWEAVSKEIRLLLRAMGPEESELVSMNTKSQALVLRGQEKRIPMPHGLALWPILRTWAARARVNHLFASAGERLITPMLARRPSIITVAKDTVTLRALDRNAPHLRRFAAVVVQAERDREWVRQAGVADERVVLIRPGVPVRPYREATGPFTILFASSPLSKHDFLTRGIHLMVAAAARLPDVRFRLVWRVHFLHKLERLIADAGVHNVEVRSGLLHDMGAEYDGVHAAILPGLEQRSFIPCPRSGLEALAHGKPVLVSRMVAIAPLVERYGCGVAFEPTIEALVDAIRQLRANYTAYQAPAQQLIREQFCPEKHLALYRRLYENVG